MRFSGLLLCTAALFACADPNIRDVPDGGSEDGVCAPAQEACDPLVTCSETRDHKPLCGACPAGYLGNGYDGCQPTLDALTLSAGQLEPAFAKDVTEYLWVTGMAAEATTFTPSAAAGITISVDGKKVRTGEKTDSLGLLPYESRVRNVQLVAPNGLTQTVKITTRRSWLWSQTVRATNRDAGDEFGRALAVSEAYLVVGAPGESSIGTGEPATNDQRSSGAAYVYDLAEGTSEAIILKARTPLQGQAFGSSLAIHGDVIAAGAPFDSSAATGIDGDSSNEDAPSSGAVWLFRGAGSNWVTTAYLKASNVGEDDHFGTSLAMDRDWIVVGAPGEASGTQDASDDSAPNAGAVYLFARSPSIREVARLKAPHPAANAEFGSSVAVGDRWVAVGARAEAGSTRGVNGDQTTLGAPNSGAVYMFKSDGAGGFVFDSYLKASNADQGDGFGWSLAFSGETLFVGAPNEASADETGADPTSNGAPGAGAVYVFARQDDAWREIAYLKSPTVSDGDSFGRRLSACSERVLIGAPGQSSRSSLAGNLADGDAKSSGAVFVLSSSPPRIDAVLKPPLTRPLGNYGASLGCNASMIAAGATGDPGELPGLDASGVTHVHR